MKVSALFKIIGKEFRKDIVRSILLFVLVDFIYANFTGVKLNKENGMVLWQGGNDLYLFGLNTVLLKLSNISIVFIVVGKIADKISSDIMIYILARTTDYRKFLCAYSVVIIVLGEMLLVVSHVVYYCFVGFGLEWAASVFFYLLVDVMGFFGVMVLYLILNNCYSLENSFTYIIGVYMVNTVLPVPILPAISTARFLAFKSLTGGVPLLLLVAGVDLTVAVFYWVLIKKRRVNVC